VLFVLVEVEVVEDLLVTDKVAEVAAQVGRTISQLLRV